MHADVARTPPHAPSRAPAPRARPHDPTLPYPKIHGRAPQVCDASKVRRSKDGVPIEAVITANMAHAHVVRTLAHATALAEPGTGFSGERAMAVDCTNSGRASGGALSPRSPGSQGGGAGALPTGFLTGGLRAAPLPECWLLLEYADFGSLMEAVVKGLFRRALITLITLKNPNNNNCLVCVSMYL